LILQAGTPATNMVFLSLADDVLWSAKEVVEKLREQGLLVSAVSERGFRLVTHYWIDDAAIEKSVAGFGRVLV
jgi:threonine aldolase